MNVIETLRQQARESPRRDEVGRIAALPRVDLADTAFQDAAVAWAMDRWARPEGSMKFRRIQALALLVAHTTGGCILPIGTGHGKTLISLFAADAMGAKRPLVLIPPSMRLPFERARKEAALHFRVPSNLRVLAYSELSNAKATDMLERLNPDAIVADEAHNIRYLESARTKRLVRFLRAHPDTRCVFMSGTLTSKSVHDYAHLAEWALKDGSPLPRQSAYHILESFAKVLDAKPTKVSGSSRYAAPAEGVDYARFAPLFPEWMDYDDTPVDPEDSEDGRPAPSPRTEEARKRFREFLIHTPGVVATDVASVGCSLYFARRPLTPPPEIAEALERLEDTWTRPDGEELVDAPAKWRASRQLTQGFYYRWVWPGGVVDDDWKFTRAMWHRQVRRVLQENRPHLDSPMLVTQQARRAVDGAESLVADDDELLEAWREWHPHSLKRWGGGRTPPTEAVWLSEYLLDDAMAWLAEPDNAKGLLWYGETTVGEKLAARGVPVYGPGTDPESVRGAHPMALSIAAHKDGKNLQYGHSRNLVLTFEPSGTVMEQLISRTHRSGQDADDVWVSYYAHTDAAADAVVSAVRAARYIQDTQGVAQRLIYGTWL